MQAYSSSSDVYFLLKILSCELHRYKSNKMEKTAKALNELRTLIAAFVKQHAITLGIIKLMSWGVFSLTSFILAWLWTPQTNAEFGEIGFIAFVVSYAPIVIWASWLGWTRYKSRREQ